MLGLPGTDIWGPLSQSHGAAYGADLWCSTDAAAASWDHPGAVASLWEAHGADGGWGEYEFAGRQPVPAYMEGGMLSTTAPVSALAQTLHTRMHVPPHEAPYAAPPVHHAKFEHLASKEPPPPPLHAAAPPPPPQMMATSPPPLAAPGYVGKGESFVEARFKLLLARGAVEMTPKPSFIKIKTVPASLVETSDNSEPESTARTRSKQGSKHSQGVAPSAQKAAHWTAAPTTPSSTPSAGSPHHSSAKQQAGGNSPGALLLRMVKEGSDTIPGLEQQNPVWPSPSRSTYFDGAAEGAALMKKLHASFEAAASPAGSRRGSKQSGKGW